MFPTWTSSGGMRTRGMSVIQHLAMRFSRDRRCVRVRNMAAIIFFSERVNFCRRGAPPARASSASPYLIATRVGQCDAIANGYSTRAGSASPYVLMPFHSTPSSWARSSSSTSVSSSEYCGAGWCGIGRLAA